MKARPNTGVQRTGVAPAADAESFGVLSVRGGWGRM